MTEVGRCGQAAPYVGQQPDGWQSTTFCRLPHGHRGWHKADDDSEWNGPLGPLDPADLADLLAAAADLLDSEEVRYTQRFNACPNGCRYEHPTHVVVGGRQQQVQPDWNAPMIRTDGPADCQTCEEGTVEDEDAPWVQPLSGAVREAASRLRPAAPTTEETP